MLKLYLIVVTIFLSLFILPTEITTSNVVVEHLLVKRTKYINKQIDCMTQALYYESRGESNEGMLAVATVIYNRVRTANYPKSVCGVINQHTWTDGEKHCQFSYKCEKQYRINDKTQWIRSKIIAENVILNHKFHNILYKKRALHYKEKSSVTAWHYHKIIKIGNHIFYA